MSESYQIPGLFLTALCHVIVIYHMAEHRYSKEKFMLYSCIYAVVFVSLMGYGFAAGGWVAVSSYMGIVVETILYSCIVSKDRFSKKFFYLSLTSVCFLFWTIY